MRCVSCFVISLAGPLVSSLSPFPQRPGEVPGISALGGTLGSLGEPRLISQQPGDRQVPRHWLFFVDEVRIPRHQLPLSSPGLRSAPPPTAEVSLPLYCPVSPRSDIWNGACHGVQPTHTGLLRDVKEKKVFNTPCSFLTALPLGEFPAISAAGATWGKNTWSLGSECSGS